MHPPAFVRCRNLFFQKRHLINLLSCAKFSRQTVIQPILKDEDSDSSSSIICSSNIKAYHEKRLKEIEAGGGPKAIHRHTVINKKMLVRERLKRLFDKDSPLLELFPFAGSEMDYGNLPAAGGVAMIGKVHGLYCIAGGSDATVKGGAVYPVSLVKQLRGQMLAFLNYLPSVHIVDSAGAFLPLQAEIFPGRDHGGRTFRNEAILSSRGIPQVSIVAGSCTAGGAYCPTMTEEAIIVKDIGLIYLGGPPLVKAATGEIIGDQELGGADMHSRVSGCTDYFAETEEEAYEMCRDTILTLNLTGEFENGVDYAEPNSDINDLNRISGKEVISRNDMYQVLCRILDGGMLKEFKAKFGANLITGFGQIQGNLVGLLANSGPLSSPDGQKGTHFLELCDRRGIPLIFLQNSAALSRDRSDWQDGMVLKDRAKMVYAHSCASVPKISINVGGCVEDDNFIMCGPSFKPNFTFSWPLAEMSIDFTEDRERLLKKISLPDEDYTDILFETPSSPYYLASRAQIDGIILPEDTRKVLGFCLDVIRSGQRNKLLASQRKTRMPLLRM